MLSPLSILGQSNDWVAINKPSGLLVHRTRISEDQVFALQLLRDQLGQRVYPVHRLDRGTSGVLLFAKHPDAARIMAQQFQLQSIHKRYLAIVRGYLPPDGRIDYPLTNESGKSRAPARSDFRRLDQCELPFAVGRYPTARYSWVEVIPHSGRFHQIRKHFSHLRHPVIGDHKHGDNKHNRFFKEKWGIDRLLLHAWQLTFLPPGQARSLQLTAPLDLVYTQALTHLGWDIQFATA